MPHHPESGNLQICTDIAIVPGISGVRHINAAVADAEIDLQDFLPSPVTGALLANLVADNRRRWQ